MTSRTSESGVALITVLLLLMLTSAMLAGFTSLAMSDARLRSADRTQTQAFYATHGALEKLTSDVGTLFMTNVAPTTVQVDALEALAPVIPGVTFVARNGGPGYTIDYDDVNGDGQPDSRPGNITTGPFEGLTGIITQYRMGVTGKVSNGPDAGGEAMLQRKMQSVAVPVFQFGVFSNQDVAFHAGSNLNFGGRVHTNGNLFLAAGTGWAVTLAQKVTAVGEVIRTHIPNGFPINVLYNGNVSMAQAPGIYRDLATGEGSLVGNIGSAQNEPTWTNTSIGTYNGYIRNGRTGARNLTLPFATAGATPIDLIRRGMVADTSFVLQQRYYSTASLRILLSDSPAEITALPGIAGGAPLQLIGAPGLATEPLATSQANPVDVAGRGVGPDLAIDTLDDTVAVRHNVYRSAAGTSQIDGFIKIEMQLPNRTWVDVTKEILDLGINGRNQAVACPPDNTPAGPSPNAILRLQRVRNFPSTAFPPVVAPNVDWCGRVPGPPGSYTQAATDYWPMALYDVREGLRRESFAGNDLDNLYLGGVMHYIELDARNLSRWFQGLTGAGTGAGALNITGYTVYFSDRRGNKNAAGVETGEYGAEDFVNPPWNGTGAANGALDGGEDVNQNGVLDVYGQTPSYLGAINTSFPPALETGLPFTNAARPWTNIADPNANPPGVWPVEGANQPTGAELAQANRAILFRRALKLTNGGLGNLIAPGLTVVAENPIYVQGDWNADGSAAPNFPAGGVATSIIADAVTLLSNNWNDVNSFTRPNNYANANRPALTTWYRFAALSGTPLTFSFGGGAEESFGADGGVHNFLRMLENWNGQTVNYLGAMAIFYFNRQATGIFKFGNNVYRSPSTRNLTFDVNFLNPALLPPLTPMFRDLNTTGFTQVIDQ